MHNEQSDQLGPELLRLTLFHLQDRVYEHAVLVIIWYLRALAAEEGVVALDILDIDVVLSGFVVVQDFQVCAEDSNDS